MRLLVSSQPVSIVRLEPDADVPPWALGLPLSSITRTETETSVICPSTALPDDLPGPVHGPMVAVVVDEVMEFTQVGVMVALLRPLADAGLPALVTSTYDTDWVLLEAAQLTTAMAVWRAAGYQVVEHQAALFPGRKDDE